MNNTCIGDIFILTCCTLHIKTFNLEEIFQINNNNNNHYLQELEGCRVLITDEKRL